MSAFFPLVLHTEVGQSITLFADGTCLGTPQLLELWLTRMEHNGAPPSQGQVAGVIFWLLLRAMQDDKRIARAPRAQPQRR